jgi:retron-type reverse transcriptase
VSQKELKKLTVPKNLYIEREEKKSGKKPRIIEEPKFQLKRIQKRIANLLSRIETPGFLFCPAKGRSNICNARQHANQAVVHKLDIKTFFASSSKRVYWFFHTVMQCASDIAGILTKLSTLKGHLPTGSPLSPILSYYTYVDMWNAIDKIVHEANCILTVYMDDLTISGSKVSRKLIWQIKEQIYRCGLKYSKEKRYTGKNREITGVIIVNGKLKLPNRQHLKMYKLRGQIQQENQAEKLSKLRQKLQGLEAQARLIQEV